MKLSLQQEASRRLTAAREELDAAWDAAGKATSRAASQRCSERVQLATVEVANARIWVRELEAGIMPRYVD
jgi:hypothetical protein